MARISYVAHVVSGFLVLAGTLLFLYLWLIGGQLTLLSMPFVYGLLGLSIAYGIFGIATFFEDLHRDLALLDPVRNLGTRIRDDGVGAVAKWPVVAETLRSVWRDVGGTVEDVGGRLRNVGTRLENDLVSAGQNLVSGIRPKN